MMRVEVKLTGAGGQVIEVVQPLIGPAAVSELTHADIKRQRDATRYRVRFLSDRLGCDTEAWYHWRELRFL